MSAVFTLDTSDFAEAFSAKVEEINSGEDPNIRAGLEAAGEIYVKFTQERYDSEGDGKWAELAVSTLKHREKINFPYPESPMLVNTGLLRGSFDIGGAEGYGPVVDANEWAWGSTVAYGMAHQQGGYPTWGVPGPQRAILVMPPADVLESMVLAMTPFFADAFA